MCSPTRRSGIVFTSSSSPPRSLGISRLHAPSVGKRPGTMAQVRIPLGPHSTARLLVMASTPALAMADGTVKGAPQERRYGEDRHHDLVALARVDPAPAGGHGAVGRAVQHDAEHRVDGA